MIISKTIFTLLMILVFVAQFVFVPFVSAQEGEVTINPTDDTYADSSNPNSNYGGQDYLLISKYEMFDIEEKIVWLKFNLSDVPDGAVVDVASLELYPWIVDETYNIYAHSCSDNSWTEFTLTYSNMPSFNATAMDSTIVASDDEWYSWNVIDAVRKGVNGIHGGPDVVTIVLQETSLHGYSQVWFHSKDEDYWPEVPKLTIHWSEIVPEFPTWTPMLIVLIALTVAIVTYKRRLDKTTLH